ncbi:hypothetical protein PVAP13_9KG414800 [Panicum virgatum]|uniref:Uncharacterized protein n=1 Tax=Panicum virgatum TaxID=38727 RepID=A0A8T0NSA5_PANVG|nr:hypothetical protein PVAP13_9KG414800 [Panicum virgatum]
MAQPVFIVAGLREALVLSVSVLLRHAPAIVELFVNKSTRVLPGWGILHYLKLHHLARLSNEVDTVLDGILPMLTANPVDADAGRLLLRYSWSISHVAGKIVADDDEGGATDEGGPRGKEGAEKLTGTGEDA